MKRPAHSWWKLSATLLVSLLFTGCTAYHAHPLPAAPDLGNTTQLTVPVTQFRIPGLAPHQTSSRGLDATTVMLLAVIHNPELKAARLQAGVADAQVLQAGLLPNPQFDASFASSVHNYGGTLGLSEQIQSWITRGAAKAAAAANERQVNLNILWLEWQTAARAEQLFIQVQTDERLTQLLDQSVRLSHAQYKTSHAAMLHGDALATTVSADLVALNHAETAQRQLQLQMNLARHQLNALLGLQSDVHLHLIGSPNFRTLSEKDFQAAAATVAHRRPDLLALQAGYKSQEENVRQAVLGQFPALTAGMALARDPIEGVNDFGPRVTISLPLFNHNQAQIALQQATRAVLWQTYQARLDAAVGQADQVRHAIAIQRREQQELAAQISTLRHTAMAARRSLLQSNLNMTAYVAIESDLLDRRAEAIQLHASIQSAQAALRVLLGLPFSD